MTVKELIELLQQFPSELEVLEQRYSDFQLMESKNWHLIEALPIPSQESYIKYHSTMNEEQKFALKTYLLFEGN